MKHGRALLALIALLASLAICHAQQQVTMQRPAPPDKWYSGESGYIKWTGGGIDVNVAYMLVGTSEYVMIKDSLKNMEYYFWQIPSDMTGSVFIRVCTTGSTSSCDQTSTGVPILAHDDTQVMSPLLWAIPTGCAVLILLSVVMCWRYRRCCFGDAEVYVPVVDDEVYQAHDQLHDDGAVVDDPPLQHHAHQQQQQQQQRQPYVNGHYGAAAAAAPPAAGAAYINQPYHQ